MNTIGIDFGTTKTLVSHMNPRTGQPEPLRLGRETHLLPTTVYIDEQGNYSFGDDADDMIMEATGSYIRGFKMMLGSATPIHVLPDGALIFARDLVREYLHFIRKKVEELVYHGEKITKATITRPVRFTPAQCQELEQAAKDAGFQHVEFTTEPEAAGLAYCHLNASHAFARNALVVDWGGGTLDFALVTRKESSVQTHTTLTDGDTSMGGEKFDGLLWNYVEQVAMQRDNKQLDYVPQLPQVRRAKEVLCSHHTFTLRLSSAAGAYPPIPLSRSEFNRLIEEDVNKAAEKVQALVRRLPIDMKPEILLLVGGSSQIPLIKEKLETVCQLPAIHWQYSREAVALGAALTSYIQVDVRTLFERAEQYFEQNRIEEAASLYLRAAESGCVDAQYLLALCYTIDKNLASALKRMQKAAEGNAENGMQEVLSDAWNENANQVEAVRWFRAAAEQGHAEAQFTLGCCYRKGICITQNATEAVRWFRAAAEQGHVEAQFTLGNCYVQGIGITQNQAAAAKWIRKAAEQGYADAQFALGSCYLEGIGIIQNRAEAAKWVRKAAEQGHADAQFALGLCYRDGIGIATNVTEAIKWISAAAEQGLDEAKGILRSYKQIFFCSICGLRISMQGISVTCSRCSADYSLDANGKVQIEAARIKCSCGTMALIQDSNPVTCTNCGSLLQWSHSNACWSCSKQSHMKNFSRHKAPDSTCSSADNLFFSGQKEQAIELYVKAAKEGSVVAQWKLALRYMEGHGVEKNLDTAEYWCNLAIQNGHDYAPRTLRIIKERRNPPSNKKGFSDPYGCLLPITLIIIWTLMAQVL